MTLSEARGGARVQTESFDLGAELAALTHGRTDIGGVGSFIGLVRAAAGLISLTLEHYPGMTEASLATIAEQAKTRFDLIDVTVIHRVGTLYPGDPIVLVLAAASHRADALAATAFLIDWLKTEAPFWKKEQFAEGARWVEARAADQEAKDAWD
jgi:molybdopterin synthase catalytic subunit